MSYFAVSRRWRNSPVAIIVQQTDELPPRIHNLVSLKERANLDLNAGQVKLLRELTDIYMRSRYPLELPFKMTKTSVEKYLKGTKELFRCFKEEL